MAVFDERFQYHNHLIVGILPLGHVAMGKKWCFPESEWGTPKSSSIFIGFSWIFSCKPAIWGIPILGNSHMLVSRSKAPVRLAWKQKSQAAKQDVFQSQVFIPQCNPNLRCFPFLPAPNIFLGGKGYRSTRLVHCWHARSDRGKTLPSALGVMPSHTRV